MTDKGAALWGVPMKHLSLITLTFQNSALVLIMHYSRIMPVVDGNRYLTSTAVFLNEVVKLAISLTIALHEISRTLPPSSPATALFEQLYTSVFSGDSWKLAIPASLYTLQNSLQYIAVSNIDAIHFQILYQLKILTTALFSVMMLGRVLTIKKWVALILLTFGVGIVQLPSTQLRNSSSVENSENKFYFPRSFHELGNLADAQLEVARELTKRGVNEIAKRSATYEGIQEDLGLVSPLMNYTVGLTAVLAAAIISGLTGVYFERVLKKSTNHVTVWTRNVQMSFYSLFPALFFGVLFKDGEEIAKRGFFDGYNIVVWAAIMFQAFGGVLVAMCINYADNIAKNFATSISIILSFVISLWLFDLEITLNCLAGTALVIYATYLYSTPDRNSIRPLPINIAHYEKITIDTCYSPRYEEVRTKSEPCSDSLDIMKPMALSSSRPSSPLRNYSRAGSWRGSKRFE
ncbi:hypothetical protein K3495_g3323 [Podosphaera aphanis]|nr:hypothetical protein K3495_g3323 [Podosphaera aphanis]